jgi:hypothetical protein
LFPKLKEFLGGKRMETDAEVKETVTAWLNGLVAESYDEEIVKLLSQVASICMVTTLKSRLM